MWFRDSLTAPFPNVERGDIGLMRCRLPQASDSANSVLSSTGRVDTQLGILGDSRATWMDEASGLHCQFHARGIAIGNARGFERTFLNTGRIATNHRQPAQRLFGSDGSVFVNAGAELEGMGKLLSAGVTDLVCTSQCGIDRPRVAGLTARYRQPRAQANVTHSYSSTPLGIWRAFGSNKRERQIQ